MSTYVGKISVGNQTASIGSTLYGVCSTAANDPDKIVTLSDFDQYLHGITVFVKFTQGNSVTSNVTLKVGTTVINPVPFILGSCICNENEVLAFTLDKTGPSGMSQLSNDWHWIVVGHVTNIEIATAAPSAVGSTSNVGTSVKYAREDHVHSISVSAGSDLGKINIAGQTVTVPGLDTLAPKANPEFSGTVTLPAITNQSADTAAATKKYVDDKVTSVLAGADAMVFKGTIGTTGNIQSLPDGSAGHTYLTGDTYRVITAGNYGTEQIPLQCEVGDLIIAIVSSGENQNSSNPNHWTVAQGNLDGVVIGPAESTNNTIALWDGQSGKLLKNSGFTVETSVPQNAVFTDTNTSYKYSLSQTTANAYTGIAQSYDSTNVNSKVLVTVHEGVLTIEEGITFATTSTVATTTLNESTDVGPVLS